MVAVGWPGVMRNSVCVWLIAGTHRDQRRSTSIDGRRRRASGSGPRAGAARTVSSPAEAFVVRELLDLPGALFDGGETVRFRGAAIALVPCRGYRVDVAVKRDQTMLAMEIDGLEFHGRTQAQFARDYLRARRLLLAGYIVIRFTATEAMSQPRQCWRDVFAVLRARRQIERLA